MKEPMTNNNNINNSFNFEPSDDELKKIEEEVKKLLNEEHK